MSNPWPAGGEAYERFCRVLAEHGSRWQSGQGWLCPAHDDHSPSLRVSEGEDGRVLLYCHADCKPEDVVAEIGLRMSDLFERVVFDHEPQMKRVATYTFTDVSGNKVHRELRFECRRFGSEPCPLHDKTFKQEGIQHHGDGRPYWAPSLKGVDTEPYRAKQLLDDSDGRTVYIVEGPKDAERLLDDYDDIVVTTPAMGAGTWEDGWCTYFVHASDVVLIADLDVEGVKHVLKVAESVERMLPEMPVSFLLPDEPTIRKARPGEPLKGLDYSDHANAGGGIESLTETDPDRLRSMLSAWGVEPEQSSTGELTEAVQNQLERLRTNDAASRLFRAERDAADLDPPSGRFSLAEELAIDEEPLPFTIAELHPTGSNTLLTAQFKTGKTTLAMELYRSLADGEPFLGAYDVAELDGRVAYWNFELSERQWRGWARRLNVQKSDRAAVEHLRGHRIPLGSPAGQAYAVEWLRSRQVTFWIVDPFGAAYDGDENSNSEEREWLRSLDTIKRLAGVTDLVLVTHTGRGEQVIGQERSRGATKLDDWADVRWLYTAESGQRFLRAHGRDVDVREFSVDFDPATGRLALGGVGDRRAVRAIRENMSIDAIVQVVAARPGLGHNELVESVQGTKTERPRYIKAAIQQGLIEVRIEGKKHAHYVVARVSKPSGPTEERSL